MIVSGAKINNPETSFMSPVTAGFTAAGLSEDSVTPTESESFGGYSTFRRPTTQSTERTTH